jgi:hypothetical protein
LNLGKGYTPSSRLAGWVPRPPRCVNLSLGRNTNREFLPPGDLPLGDGCGQRAGQRSHKSGSMQAGGWERNEWSGTAADAVPLSGRLRRHRYFEDAVGPSFLSRGFG